ncbi:ATP-binding protein [Streptomyces sp. TRM76130]|nr:ATP-binding protein [Streptomyces sp. TRM76130]
MVYHFRFASDILARLGEELIPHPEHGILELVRNAYDADASQCTVTLSNASEPDGSLSVVDDGDGMTADEIGEGFLLLGRSAKTKSPVTRSGRVKIGEKGLGRLASLRLGQEVQLVTRPREEPGVEYRLEIDWNRYVGTAAVEDVDLDVTRTTTTRDPGTEIHISRLRSSFENADLLRLARAMVLLTGLFQDQDTGFNARLSAPEFERISRLVNEHYFDDCAYKLVAELDEAGQASAVLYDWRGEVIARGDHADVARPRYKGAKDTPALFFAPPATFDLWMYLLSKKAFSDRNIAHSHTDVQRWLKLVGGVHLYHQGLRVHPYGDPGHDWLDLNERRASSPEMRPSTNTTVGRVRVLDPGQMLLQKTDRMGFVETGAFLELREFARRALDWAADRRLDIREKKRTGAAETARTTHEEEKRRFDALLKSLPAQQKAVIAPQWEKLAASEERRIQALEDDRLLYRTLGTLGTSTAVFAHEALGPAGRLGRLLHTMELAALDLLGDQQYAEHLAEPTRVAQQTAESVHAFAGLPLRLLQKPKRILTDVDINQVCTDLVKMFRPHLAPWSIDPELQLCSERPLVRSTVADIESIMANLLTNATRALMEKAAPPEGRLILIRTESEQDSVRITVADNGPGISKLAIDEIWLPGKTTSENGTGLGLTIIRDIVNDMKGSRQVLECGELGGAEFQITLPRQLRDSQVRREDK